MHKINITVSLRDGGGSWSASQFINVGEGGIVGGEDNGDFYEDDGEIESSSSGSSKTKKSSSKIGKINIGKDRVVLVNTDVDFKVEGDEESSLKYKWYFGDGDLIRGKKASHVYKFPGDYNVILSATDSLKNEEVSRIKVKVIEPEFVISKTIPGLDGYIEIENNSGREFDIYGWSLVSKDTNYKFPKYTVISSGGKIKIPNTITGIEYNNQLALHYPEGQFYKQSYPDIKQFAYNPPVYKEPIKPSISMEEKSVVKDNIEEKDSFSNQASTGGAWSSVKGFFRSLFGVH
jgi:hypothetical protein